MIWQFDIVVLVFLVVTAVIALRLKDLLAASMAFGIYSFLICLLWAGMGAVDVAFTEAAVGARGEHGDHDRDGLQHAQEVEGLMMKLAGLIAVIIVGGLLLYATGDFPAFGDPDSPASENRLSKKYIQETLVETEVPNMVTAVLADFRGYDTMFETVVIFTAGIGIIAVLMLLGGDRGPQYLPVERRQGPDLIIVKTCNLVVPVLQLFALYVVAHGHHSPGGGFQGGVMMGASFILVALGCGLQSALKRLPPERAITLAVVGILIYAGFGVVCLLLGENFLDYHILHKVMPGATETWARSNAMLGVEIGVAFTVAAIMFVIYAQLSTRGRLKEGL